MCVCVCVCVCEVHVCVCVCEVHVCVCVCVYVQVCTYIVEEGVWMCDFMKSRKMPEGQLCIYMQPNPLYANSCHKACC